MNSSSPEIIFDEYFDSGKEESISPFLTQNSRSWGKNLTLKSSLLSAGFLLLSFIFPLFDAPHSFFGLSLLFAYFFAGIPALIGAVQDVFDFEINIDVLMTLAAFLSVLIGSGREGALLLVLFAFSGALEDAVQSKAKGTLSHLKKISPTKAYVVKEGGSLVERSVKDIHINETIHVKAGEVVPLDGIVLKGSSFVNLAHLTGENLALSKKEGDEIPAGARNLEGALTLKVLRKSSESTLARIIDLVSSAEEAKPKLERWFDRLSNRYAFMIISLFFLFACFLPFFFDMPYFGREGSIYRSLSFLIAASPCALIIALPIAYLSALSVSASKGILCKGGVILDALASCSIVAMDKTGTLTEGNLECISCEGEGDLDEATQAAFSLERSSHHPIADAITRWGLEKKIEPVTIEDFESKAGFGLKGVFKGKKAAIGNADFILPQLRNEEQKKLSEKIKSFEGEGVIFTILLLEDTLFYFYFKDQVRPSSRSVVQKLKQQGFRVVMLTGDHHAVATKVAKEVGIEEFSAGLRPDQKLEKIADFAGQANLAMVGDGINDAPALARATVGISMGRGGSQMAIDASDIILLGDNLELVPWLLKKAKKTREIVTENLIIAALAILVAIVPALSGLLPLWLAVVIHEGGTVLVGLNALRLLKS